MTQSLSSHWPVMLGETCLTCSCYVAFPVILFSESLVLEQVFCFLSPSETIPWCRLGLTWWPGLLVQSMRAADSEQQGSLRGPSTSSAVIQPLKLLSSCSGDSLRGWGLPGSYEEPRGCFF